MAALAKQHASSLAVRSNPIESALADCLAGMAASPAALASNLAYLQIDLTEPDFRRHLVKQARATRVALRRLVQAVVQAGELARNVQPAQLKRTIEATKSGSMLTCAFYQQATAARWIRADLNAVLAPYARKPPDDDICARLLAELLRTIAKIRNVIVHDKTEPFRYVVIPTSSIAEELRKCRERLINPSLAAPSPCSSARWK